MNNQQTSPGGNEKFPPKATSSIIGGTAIWLIIIGFIVWLFATRLIGIVLILIGAVTVGSMWIINLVTKFLKHYDDWREK